MGRLVSHKNTEGVEISVLRSSTLKDAGFLAANLRKEDIDEVRAQSGSSPQEGILYCYFMSKPCVTMISRKGKIMGLYGVVPEGGKTGRIWMLGCEEMVNDVQDKCRFLQESKRQLAKLQKSYPLLFNVVDARNKVHIKWLRWMGFTFIQKHSEWGPERRLFYEFVRI